MTTTPSIAAQALFGVGPTSTVNQAMEVLSSTLKKTTTHAHSPGLRGSRSRRKERVRQVRTAVAGSWTLNPTPTEIDWWLPKILGGTTAVGVTDVGETLTEFFAAIDKIVKVPVYSGLRVAKATLSGSSGEPLSLVIDMEGENETDGAAGSFPVISLPTDNMFVFSDLVLTLEGSAREVDSFSLTIDNALLMDLYRNSLTRAEIPASDRIVTLDCQVPYTTDNADLYEAAIAGAAASLAISDGTTTYTIAIANAKIPDNGPEVPALGAELPLALSVGCYADASNSECKVTKS